MNDCSATFIRFVQALSHPAVFTWSGSIDASCAGVGVVVWNGVGHCLVPAGKCQRENAGEPAGSERTLEWGSHFLNSECAPADPIPTSCRVTIMRIIARQ